MQDKIHAFLMGTRSPKCCIPPELVIRIAKLAWEMEKEPQRIIAMIREQILIHQWTPVCEEEYLGDPRALHRKILYENGEQLCKLLEHGGPDMIRASGKKYLNAFTAVNSGKVDFIVMVSWLAGFALGH